MIRKLNGELISYIHNRKVSLTHIEEDIGLLKIDNQTVGKCPFSYTKSEIEKVEQMAKTRRVYIEDDEVLYKDLSVGTLIDYKG
ncbi:hypothetical protein [Pseudalkalibacillus sp. SCS-8]|uniref:hypothetical protein n=1 Tax=Pseudalkalibacillus nanhaiensis TaxID=3115291 RepID=UPI0032DA487F